MNGKKDHIILLVFITLVLLVFNNSGNDHRWGKDTHAVTRCTVSREMTAGIQGAHFRLFEKGVAALSAVKVLYTPETREFLKTVSADMQIDRQVLTRQSCDISPPFPSRHLYAKSSEDGEPPIS